MFFLGTSTTLQFNCMVGRKLMLLRDACWKDNLCVLPSDSGSKPFKCQKLRFGVGAKRRRPMTWSVKWFMIYLEPETWNGCLGLKLWLFTLNIQKIYNTSRINCFPSLRNVELQVTMSCWCLTRICLFNGSMNGPRQPQLSASSIVALTRTTQTYNR